MAHDVDPLQLNLAQKLLNGFYGFHHVVEVTHHVPDVPNRSLQKVDEYRHGKHIRKSEILKQLNRAVGPNPKHNTKEHACRDNK